MKYIRIFCIECRKDKKKRYNFLLDKMNRSNKKLPHRFKVSNDVIQGTPLMHTLNEFITVTCKCLIKVINTTNRGSNN